MKGFTKGNILISITLFILPILYVLLSEIIIVHNDSFTQIFLLLAVAIVVGTVYVLQLWIIKRSSTFMIKGLFGNNPLIIVVGTFILIFLIVTITLLFNNLFVDPFLQRLLTFLFAYPVMFIFIMIIGAFYKNILSGTRENILIISSFTVFIGLAILILLALFRNPTF